MALKDVNSHATLLLEQHIDVLSDEFTEAKLVSMQEILPFLSEPAKAWTSSVESNNWTAFYKATTSGIEVKDKSWQELSTIQPAFNTLCSRSPRQGWKFFDTHNGHENTTQDSLMCFVGGGRRFSDIVRFTAVGLVVELMGQDASCCPDKSHKAKFIRDLARIIKLRGPQFPLYGIITDLARITVVKVIGWDGIFPNMIRYSGAGRDVQDILTAFANASSSELGVTEENLCFENLSLNLIAIPKSVISSGAHGVVYSDVYHGDNVIKKFRSKEFYCSEKHALFMLGSIFGVPKLYFFDEEKLACILQPYGTVLKTYIHGLFSAPVSCVDFLCFSARSLVTLLQKVHQQNVVHRDVRASNIIVKDLTIFLIDWASSAPSNQSILYSGTTHYAALEVLLKLSTGFTSIKACPEYDLESLIYTIYDICVPSVELRQIEKKSFNLIYDYWSNASKLDGSLENLLSYARSLDYLELSKHENWIKIFSSSKYQLSAP